MQRIGELASEVTRKRKIADPIRSSETHALIPSPLKIKPRDGAKRERVGRSMFKSVEAKSVVLQDENPCPPHTRW
jgi:hypothetical protein